MLNHSLYFISLRLRVKWSISSAITQSAQNESPDTHISCWVICWVIRWVILDHRPDTRISCWVMRWLILVAESLLIFYFTQVASKVKHFFYAINRHKMTILMPTYHAESYTESYLLLSHFLYFISLRLRVRLSISSAIMQLTGTRWRCWRPRIMLNRTVQMTTDLITDSSSTTLSGPGSSES